MLTPVPSWGSGPLTQQVYGLLQDGDYGHAADLLEELLEVGWAECAARGGAPAGAVTVAARTARCRSGPAAGRASRCWPTAASTGRNLTRRRSCEREQAALLPAGRSPLSYAY